VTEDGPPKYTRWEHERKFLVPHGLPHPWAHSAPWEITDRYFDVGRLRLRSVTDTTSGEKIFKLCKKFASDSPFSQPIVNIYLSQEEYESLRVLPAHELRKRRFHDEFEGRTFGIDVFEAELDGLILCEIEADSVGELMSIEFPAYARIEVTDDLFFTGGTLCRASASGLARKLSVV
jgi:CYTH domain-containing protein